MIYHVKRPGNDEIVNVLVWFGNSSIDGCTNALLLHGGEAVLLEPKKRFAFRELAELAQLENRKKWLSVFGSNHATDLLRAGINEAKKVLPFW